MADPSSFPLRTLRLYADPLHVEQAALAVGQAASILRAGGTVAFATETVYGLGANALDAAAVEKIFIAKQRPAWDPLIVHLADPAMLPAVTSSVPEAARLWMDIFWPGPLTLLLPRSAAIPDAVTAGRPRVGVRMPRHPVALALLRAAGLPIAAPSANLFGHVSPTTAAHVLADLDGRIDAVLDGGAAVHGVESTVVDACEDPCIVYRPGAVTLEQLAAVWPRVRLYSGATTQVARPGTAVEPLKEVSAAGMPSPGIDLRHYAPRAQLQLVEHGPGQTQALVDLAREQRSSGGATGMLLPGDFLSADQQAELPPGLILQAWGSWQQPDEQARLLFAGLRALDAAGVARILCPLPANTGIGAAICDRLRKGAHPR